MPLSDQLPALLALSAAPAPSTPLGPFEDSAVAWTTWVTLMGFVGVTTLALVAAGPAARRISAGTPAAGPGDWGRTTFERVVWRLHLSGGAVWLGGLAGLALLAVPGAVASADRGAFWSAMVRRFSATAMSCVASIALSGLFLYWEHV